MGMEHGNALNEILKHLAEDIRLFIELSLQESDASWDEWLDLVRKNVSVRCWERKDCHNISCPARNNYKERCWLVAGTMCGGKVQGEFALKYKSCTQCDVYVESVFGDPATEIYEHVLTLVHSFRTTQARLKTLATRDPLTGLYNRNYFNEIILNEIERTKRYGNSFSVVMLDIDNFKWINDNYGHIFGDKLLKDCAGILTDCVRAADILVRYGGDEFVIIIPEGERNKCTEVIQRLDSRIGEWNLRYANPDYSLSISSGCASYEQGREIMAVLKEADERMYLAKKAS
ncbi:MAG: GGDEF domain-containing protein [Nitrospiraceae bacterium]|nr:GGDEF domain-containing protein [Nitrospiraceae bacterium]